MIEYLKSLVNNTVGGSRSRATFTVRKTNNYQAALRGAAGIAQAYHKVPSLHSVANQVSSDLAAIPWTVKTRQGTERDTSPIQQSFLSDTASPNPHMSAYDFRKIMVLHFLLVGEFFAVKLDDGLYPIPPSDMSIGHHKETGGLYFDINMSGDLWRFQGRAAESSVIWLKNTDISNPYGRGRGLGHALAHELEIDEFAATYLAHYFKNNATPRRIIHAVGADKDSLEKMKEYLQGNYGGAHNAGKTLLTGDSESMLQIARVEDSPTDSSLLEVREQTKKIIRETWGIPPAVLGDMSQSGGVFESIDAEYYLYAKSFLVPKLRELQSALQKINRDHFGSNDSLLFEDPVPENAQFKKEIIKEAPHAFTINEIRSLAGMKPRPDGDAYWRNGQPTPAANIEENEDMMIVDMKDWDLGDKNHG